MCVFKKPKMPSIAIPSRDNAAASRDATIEARLRQARSGAAANILTSPLGLPVNANAALGGS